MPQNRHPKRLNTLPAGIRPHRDTPCAARHTITPPVKILSATHAPTSKTPRQTMQHHIVGISSDREPSLRQGHAFFRIFATENTTANGKQDKRPDSAPYGPTIQVAPVARNRGGRQRPRNSHGIHRDGADRHGQIRTRQGERIHTHRPPAEILYGRAGTLRLHPAELLRRHGGTLLHGALRPYGYPW